MRVKLNVLPKMLTNYKLVFKKGITPNYTSCLNMLKKNKHRQHKMQINSIQLQMKVNIL